MSDYSSIIIDYLILDRPIAIYDYDYEIYKEENGFCYEFDGFCPGIRINSQEELIYFFSNFQNNDGMREKRGIESERFNGKVNNSVKVFKKEVLERDNVK
ncbi:CDP-glycerol glycerophosphotransferase family protein [Vibrio cyclitrophicus]|uniref:CDP-glycerol glycerophosphotransferase family protein n=1 Tax=Vibrio cyclitrophicus TaxID=47951 RepID=UPI00399BBDEF